MSHGAGPAQDLDLIAVNTLLLLHAPATAAEMQSRFAALGVALQSARADEPLTRLAALGLARVASTAEGVPRYVQTTLGYEHAQSVPGTEAVLTEHLAELERLRTEFLSAIAHELRTPLTAMRTCIGLLQHEAGDAEPEIRDRLLRTIASGAETMHTLISDLLDLARFRSGHIELQLQYFDAWELARNAAAVVTPLADARGQQLALEAPGEPVQVYADRRRAEQALMNLLSNAHKFSPDGSPIRLTVGAEGGDVIWNVSDQGPGIPAQDQPHLFERFFRGGRDTPGEGAGLGLPIALAIAQAHGGTIGLRSEPGQGSVFTLRLPAEGPRPDPRVRTRVYWNLVSDGARGVQQ